MSTAVEDVNKLNQIISENIDDPIFLLNENFACEYTNSKILGENKLFINFFHPNETDYITKLLKNILKIGNGIGEARMKLEGNKYNWFEIRGKRIQPDNKSKKLFLICRDITNYKKKEEFYKKSQEKLNQLADSLPEIRYWKFLQSKEGIKIVQKTREMLERVIDNIPQLIYWKDKDLVYLGSNKNYAQINGIHEPSNIIGKTDNDLTWLKYNLSHIQERETQVIIKNKAEYNIVESLITPGGNQAWFEINRIPLLDLEGNVVGILVTYENITNRKTAEQKLKESEEKYRTIFNASPDYIYITDIKGNILEMNPILLEIIGLSLEEAREMNFSDFYAGDNLDELQEVAKALIAGEVVKEIEIKAKSKLGRVFEYEVNSVPLKEDGNVTKILNLARDISFRKEAEEKLRESERKYRNIIENTKDAIVIIGLDGKFKFVSPQLTTMLGGGREINLQTELFSNIHPDDIKNLVDLFSKAVREKNVLTGEDVEYRTLHQNGHYIWLSSASKNYHDEDGNIIGFITLIHDITDRKIAEQKLKESEKKYRHLFKSSPYGIILVNRKGQILDANPATEILFGRNMEELINENFLNIRIKPEKLLPEFKQRYETILKGKIPKPLEVQITRSKDGGKIWISIDDSLVEVGGEILFQVIVQDITGKKNAEKKLKKSQEELQILNRELEQKVKERTKNLIESERQYRTTINSLADPLHVVDRDLRLILVNKELQIWLKELNINSSVHGKKVFEVFSFLSSKVHEEYMQVFDTGIPLITKETTMLENFDVITETRKIPIFSKGNVEQVITIIRDITESFKLEQELRESERKLREQNIELMKMDKTKNDFITMAAHELKTPLISISGYTDYILMKHRNHLNPEITEDLRIVQRNIKRLEILMDKLLEVMKIDEDKLKLQIEPTNITNIINNCLNELSYLINEKNMEIILNIDIEMMLNVDPTRIMTVFTNLISNAIKFSPEYGWIEISSKKEKNQYIFKVKDNGIGLTENEIERLFKKFERIKQPIISKSINIKDTGTGLGLYITKGIVNAHGGEIWATSEGENKGSTFTFALPF